MKTKQQLESSLRKIGIKASDFIYDLANRVVAGEDVSKFDKALGQTLAAVDCLLWTLGDDERTLDEYLRDQTRGPDLLAFLDRFSREQRQ